MTNNVLVQAFKSLIIDMIGEILYFPIWWYTVGLKRAIFYFIDSIKNTNRNLALTLLIRHLFRPMFGVEDRTGRAISFFMRIFIILFRLIFFIVLVVFYLVVFIFWIILPVMVVWGIRTNLAALWK